MSKAHNIKLCLTLSRGTLSEFQDRFSLNPPSRQLFVFLWQTPRPNFKGSDLTACTKAASNKWCLLFDSHESFFSNRNEKNFCQKERLIGYLARCTLHLIKPCIWHSLARSRYWSGWISPQCEENFSPKPSLNVWVWIKFQGGSDMTACTTTWAIKSVHSKLRLPRCPSFKSERKFSHTQVRMSGCRSFAQAASALSTHAQNIDMQLLLAHLDPSSYSKSRLHFSHSGKLYGYRIKPRDTSDLTAAHARDTYRFSHLL